MALILAYICLVLGVISLVICLSLSIVNLIDDKNELPLKPLILGILLVGLAFFYASSKLVNIRITEAELFYILQMTESKTIEKR